MSEEKIKKLEARIEQLEEETYNSGNNSGKLKQKIGKTQTAVRKLKEEIEEQEKRVEGNSDEIKRLKDEKQILEDLKSLADKVERKSEKAQQKIQDKASNKVKEIRKEKQGFNKEVEKAENKLSHFEDLVEQFENETSELEADIVQVQANTTTLQLLDTFLLSQRLIPDEFQKMVEDRLSDPYLLGPDNQNQIIAFVVNWAEIVQRVEDEEGYNEDPTEDEDLFKSYLIDHRLLVATDGDWNNLDELDHMMTEEFMTTEKGQNINDAVNEALGSFEADNIAGEDPVMFIKNNAPEEKKEEAVDWFKNQYEKKTHKEAVSAYLESSFADPETELEEYGVKEEGETE